MPKWKLTVEYDGTDFCGWQRQPNGPTIQAAVEDALQRLHSGDLVRTTAAGRTDAGVHARGQVVSFQTKRDLIANAYERGLNMYLPRSIAIRRVEAVPPEFDARRWARGKRYKYRLLRSRFRSPLRERYSWLVHQPLDLDVMRRAADHLQGRHDFASFRASNCEAKTTVREVRQITITEDGEELVLTFEATAFLKNMVRALVGTLWEVGIGRRSADQVPKLLQTPDRTAAGPTAPPQGLCLEEVFYDLAAGPPRKDGAPDGDDD